MSKGKSRRIRSAKAPNKKRDEIQKRLEEAFGRSYPPQSDNTDEPWDDGTGAFSPANTPAPLDALGRKKEMFEPTRRVTVLEDHGLKMPELWLTVFVFGPAHEAGPFARYFARAKCFKADTPDDADLVVFVGGEDVDPALYGEKAHKSTDFNPARDRQDIELYKFCESRGIPMYGVCRGAQLLHVMNRGKLIQDLNNHNGPHSMYSIPDKEFIERVSSVHHQACIQNVLGGMEIIATSAKADTRWLNDKDCITGSQSDVEAYFYRDTCCIGIQGHPEYAGYNYFTVWSLKLLDHYLNENPDLEYRKNDSNNNKLRIKREVMEQVAAERAKTNKKSNQSTALVPIPSEDMIIVEQTTTKG